MKNLLTFFLLVSACSLSQGQDLITNTYQRPSTDLNGPWKYIVDPYENGFYNYRYEPFENQSNPGNGAFFTNAKPQSKSDLIEYNFDLMDNIKVPGDWNTQKEKLFYYEGSIWYKRSFDYQKKSQDNRVFLHFGGVNYKADVYLNGKKLGQHLGGFTPFQFEVSEHLKQKDNFLILKVDNQRKKEGVPTLNTDWWNYGGITRDVKLIETPDTYIKTYRLALSKTKKNHIEGELFLEGSQRANQAVHIQIPELKIDQRFKTDGNGKLVFSLKPRRLSTWLPENPKLYTIKISTEGDSIEEEMGFRTIETQGADILLNGKSIFLKGISIHEESPYSGGRSTTIEDAERLLSWAKELGCNYVRLAHYPHNEHMVRVADRMGLLVWEEIPVYWTIDWSNPSTYQNAQNQLGEMLQRDYNRASVIIWSMANETPNSPARNTFLNKLASFTKATDPNRLISAALEQQSISDDGFTRTISDPFAEVVDLLSFNQYIGWYDGPIEKCRQIQWDIPQDKPVIISEFGAGAKYGLRGSKEERWTEDYQAYLYEETLKMLNKIEQFRGVSPWILVDFRSPRRVLAEIQDNYNRKGLISEKGEKKKAFYILQEFYKSKSN